MLRQAWVAWPVMSAASEPFGASPGVPETTIWSWSAGTRTASA